MSNTKPSAKVVPLKGRKCPVCGKAADVNVRPFCSKRCADLDLGRWLGGTYRIPTEEPPGDTQFADEDDDRQR